MAVLHFWNPFFKQGSSYKKWLSQQEIESQVIRRKLDILEAEKIQIDKRAENRRLCHRLHTERQGTESEERILQVSV
jgi:hypothetical protein